MELNQGYEHDDFPPPPTLELNSLNPPIIPDREGNPDRREDMRGDNGSTKGEFGGTRGEYGEYFMPANTVKKSFRGEKLYVTKTDDGSARRLRRFCCWMGSLVLLAAAITLAALIGVGVINTSSSSSPDTPPPKDRPDLKTVLADPEAFLNSLVSEETSSLTNQNNTVPNALGLSLKIENQQWSDDLRDNSSHLYNQLKNSMESGMKELMDLANLTVIVDEFLPGSVVVRMRLAWPVGPGRSRGEVRRRLVKQLRQEREERNVWPDIVFNSTAIVINKEYDHCLDRNCSDSCQFSAVTADFVCTCPPEMELADELNCVPTVFVPPRPAQNESGNWREDEEMVEPAVTVAATDTPGILLEPEVPNKAAEIEDIRSQILVINSTIQELLPNVSSQVPPKHQRQQEISSIKEGMETIARTIEELAVSDAVTEEKLNSTENHPNKGTIREKEEHSNLFLSDGGSGMLGEEDEETTEQQMISALPESERLMEDNLEVDNQELERLPENVLVSNSDNLEEDIDSFSFTHAEDTTDSWPFGVTTVAKDDVSETTVINDFGNFDSSELEPKENSSITIGYQTDTTTEKVTTGLFLSLETNTQEIIPEMLEKIKNNHLASIAQILSSSSGIGHSYSPLLVEDNIPDTTSNLDVDLTTFSSRDVVDYSDVPERVSTKFNWESDDSLLPENPADTTVADDSTEYPTAGHTETSVDLNSEPFVLPISSTGKSSGIEKLAADPGSKLNCTSGLSCDGRCLSRAAICNSWQDCRDGWDEQDCDQSVLECNQTDEYKCGTECIPRDWVCDGKPDCTDGQDELGCSSFCSPEEFLCRGEGRCLPGSLQCDGREDCVGGEDEADCECGEGSVQCVLGGGCVPVERLCDGHVDCPDRSDEWNCTRITDSTLQIRRGMNWGTVCADSWSQSLSSSYCRQAGSGEPVATIKHNITHQHLHQVFWLPADSTSVDLPLQGELTSTGSWAGDNSTCSSTVEVRCQMKECGAWRVPSGAEAGLHWPSLAILYNTRTISTCTVSVLSPGWVITSYSCIRDKSLEPADWMLFSGTARPQGEGQDRRDRGLQEGQGTQVISVAAILPHPGNRRHQHLTENNLVLVKLQTNLALTSTVSPVCFPSAGIKHSQQCVAAGWAEGSTQGVSFNQYLSYLPQPLVDLNSCNSSSSYGGHLTQDVFCSEDRGDSRQCQNDEGSALMCLTEQGSWELQGILSRRGSTCEEGEEGDEEQGYSRPSVFTSVEDARLWIDNTIGWLS